MAVTIMNMTNRIIMNMKKCLRVKKKKKRENDMGVYIPNMEKPKSCNDCLFQMIDGDFVRNEWLTIESCLIKDDEADGCPLIEIDLEKDIPTIWYNRQTRRYEPKGTKQEVYERLYKLKNGERRE